MGNNLAAVLRINALWRLHCCGLAVCGFGEGRRRRYAFLNKTDGVAFVGNSNLSEPGLTTTLEWNYKVISGTDIQGFKEIRDGFEALLKDPASAVVNEDWIARYEQRRIVPIHKEAAVAEEPTEPSPELHARLAGEQREIQADFLFASVQTLARINHLSHFQPDDFDYIVIDEFHHAAANTYRRVATPDTTIAALRHQ
jgi:hypothetical protein